ncbi:asparagine synthase-related protein [Streptomyces sp. NPDC057137]|uniref:asparagine synthase-related protein n=1 Tax=Streptomyces sp. NPDC057137 TaxID=3346030 RepID=UPI0036445F66
MGTSTDTTRAPELIGVFPSVAGGAGRAGPTGSGDSVQVQGRWRDGELRRIDGPEGTAVVLGQCLADDDRLRGAALRALASGRSDELTRLPGSYLCLVIREHELTAYVDAAGQYPLFFRDTGACFVFGTRPVSVADAAGTRRRPDTAVVAAGIFCPGAPALTGERSVVAGVDKLGGGQALRRTARGRVERWVHEPLETDPQASFARSADALREALETAVRLRVAGGQRVTADFSGGLDSTSLAFLTLHHKSGPLSVTTYRSGAASACDDLVHAERFARLDPRLRMEVVTGARETLTYQGLTGRTGDDGRGSGDSGEPDSAAVALARTRLRLAHVVRLGGEVHLGGEGGDALLVAPPGYLAALARPERLRRLARDSRELARARREAPSAVAARAVGLARTPLATAFRRLADGFERRAVRNADDVGGIGGVGAVGAVGAVERAAAHDIDWLDAIAWWPEPGSEAGWLTRAASRELAGLARQAAETAGHTAGSRAGDLTALDNLRTSGAVQRQLSETARPFGVWPQAPFLDTDVIRACAALPAHLRAAPPAFKPLLGAALADLVPAPVLARRTKGDYGDEDYQGARACARELRSMLLDSRLAELGVIEPAAVTAALDGALMGLRAPFPTLNRLLAAEIWLRNTTWH